MAIPRAPHRLSHPREARRPRVCSRTGPVIAQSSKLLSRPWLPGQHKLKRTKNLYTFTPVPSFLLRHNRSIDTKQRNNSNLAGASSQGSEPAALACPAKSRITPLVTRSGWKLNGSRVAWAKAPQLGQAETDWLQLSPSVSTLWVPDGPFLGSNGALRRRDRDTQTMRRFSSSTWGRGAML